MVTRHSAEQEKRNLMTTKLRDARGRFVSDSNGRAQQLAMQMLVDNAVMSRRAFFEQAQDRRRSIDDECGYPKRGTITAEDYRFFYDRFGIATRVVQVLSDESWLTQPEVFEDEDPETETEFELAWKTLDKQLHGTSWYQDAEGSPVWEHLHRADVLSGIGSYGVLLLGLDDGKELRDPVEGIDESGRKVGNSTGRQLLYLRAFDESLVEIPAYEVDRANPRFGQPTKYNITFNDPREQQSGRAGVDTTTTEVHWSRVIHLADNLGSSEIFGAPRQRPVYNHLMDLRKLYGGSAEMYWKGAFPGLFFGTHPEFPEVKVTSASKDAIEQYQNTLQRYLAIPGVTAESLAPQVVDPTPQINVHLEAICVQLKIPKRILLGSERGELASSQDKGTWNDRLQARQLGYLTPRVIVPFADRLITIGVLPEPKGYSVVWPDLDSLTEQEQATVAVQRTEALAKYVLGNVNILVPPAEYLTEVLGWSAEKVESILESAMAVVQDDLLTIPEEEEDETPSGEV